MMVRYAAFVRRVMVPHNSRAPDFDVTFTNVSLQKPGFAQWLQGGCLCTGAHNVALIRRKRPPSSIFSILEINILEKVQFPNLQ